MVSIGSVVKFILIPTLIVIFVILYFLSVSAHSHHEYVSPLSKKQKSDLYSKATKLWSQMDDKSFKQSKIFLKIPEVSKDHYIQFVHTKNENGLYYPLRDEQNDYLEYEHRVSYFQATVPYSSIPQDTFWIDLQISTSIQGDKIQYRVPLKQQFEIEAQRLGCAKCTKKQGSTSCTYKKECPVCINQYYGRYQNGKCYTNAYLNDLCFRVVPDKNNIVYDENSLLYNNDKNQPGCAYSTNHYLYDLPPWSPFSYSPQRVDSFNITLRHYKDPYIIASNITAGCSSMVDNQNKTNCLGSTYDDLYHMVFLTFGPLSIVVLLFVVFLFIGIYWYMKVNNRKLLKYFTNKYY